MYSMYLNKYVLGFMMDVHTFLGKEIQVRSPQSEDDSCPETYDLKNMKTRFINCPQNNMNNLKVKMMTFIHTYIHTYIHTSNVTVCPFVVQESYLRNTYIRRRLAY